MYVFGLMNSSFNKMFDQSKLEMRFLSEIWQFNDIELNAYIACVYFQLLMAGPAPRASNDNIIVQNEYYCSE